MTTISPSGSVPRRYAFRLPRITSPSLNHSRFATIANHRFVRRQTDQSECVVVAVVFVIPAFRCRVMSFLSADHHSFGPASMGSPSNGSKCMTSRIFGKDARADATLRVCAFVRRRYPVKTATCFEDDTKIAAATFRKWDAGIASPSLLHFLKCIEVYGPECLHAALGSYAPDWLLADVREARMAALERDRAAAEAALAELRRA